MVLAFEQVANLVMRAIHSDQSPWRMAL